MNAIAAPKWPLFAEYALVALSLLGMGIAIVFHGDVQTSRALDVVIGIGVLAGIGGATGGLLLASARRNVMWILATAMATTAVMALLAIVMQSFARA
jgi:hypothetical protein